MKTDKALLKMGNFSLFERALSGLNNAALDEVIISGEKHGGIADKLPAKGPFSGIHAAVMSGHMVNGDRLLVLPVDTPFVSIQMLNTLITHSRRSQQSCFYAASYLPLCLVINERLKQYLESAEQQQGSYRIERLLGAINANANRSAISSDEYKLSDRFDAGPKTSRPSI